MLACVGQWRCHKVSRIGTAFVGSCPKRFGLNGKQAFKTIFKGSRIAKKSLRCAGAVKVEPCFGPFWKSCAVRHVVRMHRKSELRPQSTTDSAASSEKFVLLSGNCESLGSSVTS